MSISLVLVMVTSFSPVQAHHDKGSRGNCQLSSSCHYCFSTSQDSSESGKAWHQSDSFDISRCSHQVTCSVLVHRSTLGRVEETCMASSYYL